MLSHFTSREGVRPATIMQQITVYTMIWGVFHLNLDMIKPPTRWPAAAAGTRTAPKQKFPEKSYDAQFHIQ